LAVTQRSYDQFCPVATSLDILGDRWSLLLMRDLLWNGPSRFQTRMEGNPGLSPALLTARLSELTDHGMIEKRPVGKRHEYALTEHGRGVEPLIDTLYRLGATMLPHVVLNDAKLDYAVLFAARRQGNDLVGHPEPRSVRCIVDNATTTVVVGPGTMRVQRTSEPVGSVRIGLVDLGGLMVGVLTPEQVEPSELDGEIEAARAVLAAFTPS
jgi:DNA-binding HxlR family transcriptional regulator